MNSLRKTTGWLLLIMSYGITGWTDTDDYEKTTSDAGMIEIGDFFIDRFEYPNTEGLLPTVDVSWKEAQSLCQSKGKRLCSEKEWTTACLGPENLIYGYGNKYEPERCNVPYNNGNLWIRDGLAVSGEHESCSSSYGVKDLIGNAWEWTDGWYNSYRGWRIVRGGSWFNSVNMARADRGYGKFLTDDYSVDLIGFRCCRSNIDNQNP